MPIDLRSDTITQPTPAMREAMARAEVGDDVLGDDPTVARLEAHVAKRVFHSISSLKKSSSAKIHQKS